ncbi:unnamed protein product, partial [Porites lobata]
VLSDYVKGLESHVKSRYLQKISVVGVDPASIPTFFDKLNQCNVKPVALSLIKDYADQFVAKSRSVPVVSDLFETVNLELQYPELLRKCVNVQLDITNEDISKVE